MALAVAYALASVLITEPLALLGNSEVDRTMDFRLSPIKIDLGQISRPLTRSPA